MKFLVKFHSTFANIEISVGEFWSFFSPSKIWTRGEPANEEIVALKRIRKEKAETEARGGGERGARGGGERGARGGGYGGETRKC